MAKLNPACGQIFFDLRTQNYWMQLPNGRYLNLDANRIKRQLQMSGLDIEQEDSSTGLKYGELILAKSEAQNYVDYAGPIAGHRIGLIVTTGQKRILVTEEIKPLPAGKDTDCPNCEKFLGELLGPEQTTYWLLWHKFARESLVKQDFRAAQMLTLCGKSGCGKSLAQQLTTELLGGRVAKPYRYMAGKTNFNADLFEAEHLCLEDENASTSIGARREFGTAIKEMCVNPLVSLHDKGKKAFTLKVFKRLTNSMNDEAEKMMIIPPLDDDVADKIILFLCGKANLSGKREQDWKRFSDELPALARLIDTMPVPKEMRDTRYGVKTYHNPELFEILSNMSPEQRLLSLIEEVIQPAANEPLLFDGTAEELELQLRKSSFAFAVESLLRFNSACGTYLARLEKRMPTRFESRKLRSKTMWRIKKENPQ